MFTTALEGWSPASLALSPLELDLTKVWWKCRVYAAFPPDLVAGWVGEDRLWSAWCPSCVAGVPLRGCARRPAAMALKLKQKPESLPHGPQDLDRNDSQRSTHQALY